jgi:hypothetical protein
LRPIRIEANGLKVYDADVMQGRSYLGEEVVLLMHLPLDKDITFSVEEKNIKIDPKPWSLVKMDIKGNPYITDRELYASNGWTITNIGETKTIPKAGIYKYFEAMCQTTPVYTYLPAWTEANKLVKQEKRAKGEKFKKSTPVENSTLMWFVVGNELTASKPLVDAREIHHVFYQLIRVRTVESFKRNDPNNKDKMIGLLPYKFDCIQWVGKYHGKNPTLMKFQMEISLGWKHVCPSAFTSDNYKPSSNNSLRINSIMAWTCLMAANYPHLKIAINAKENLEGVAGIQLNSNRYGEGILRGDPNFINKPFGTDVARLTLLTFKKLLWIQKAIILPLETIKGCCIPVTQDYVVNSVWGGRRGPPTISEGLTQLDSVALLPVDFNDSVHCLSESSGTEQFFSEPLDLPNQRYNFYAMTNVCFRETKDENGKDRSSISRMIEFLPKSPQEGVIYLEAIRNIISSGGHTDGCFETERSVTDIGSGSIDEKYKRFLAKYLVPSKSILHKLDPSELTIFHPETKLLVYIYAIPSHLDDPDTNRGGIVGNLRSGLSSEISSFLNKSNNEEEDNSEDKESEDDDSEDDGKSSNTQNGTKTDADTSKDQTDVNKKKDNEETTVSKSEGQSDGDALISSEEEPERKDKERRASTTNSTQAMSDDDDGGDDDEDKDKDEKSEDD